MTITPPHRKREKRVSVAFPPYVWSYLNKRASDEYCPVSSIITRIVIEHVKDNEKLSDQVQERKSLNDTTSDVLAAMDRLRLNNTKKEVVPQEIELQDIELTEEQIDMITDTYKGKTVLEFLKELDAKSGYDLKTKLKLRDAFNKKYS